MASISQINPMSSQAFGTWGDNTGVGQAVQGIGSLGNAIIGNPQQRAMSMYYGAETGRAQGQAQALQDTRDAQQQVAAILTDPNALRDPASVQRAAAIVATQPELAAKFPAMMAAMFQANTATGGAVPQQTSDRFSAGVGSQNYGQTATGYGAGLANAIQQSNISAGATLGSARIAADASMANERARVGESRYEYENKPIPTMGASGPVYVIQKNAAGTTPTTEQAITSEQTRIPVMKPDGGTGYAVPSTPDVRPIPQSTNAEVARIIANQPGVPGAPPVAATPPTAITPGYGTPGSPDAAQQPAAVSPTGVPPPVGSSSPSSVGAIKPTGNPMVDAVIRKETGEAQTVPAPAPDTGDAGQKLDAALSTSLARNFITPEMTRGYFTVDPKQLRVEPQARAALLARVNQLVRGADPNFKNNTDASIEQAIHEFQQNGSLTLDHGHSINPFSSAGPTIRWNPPAPQPAAPQPPSPVVTAVTQPPAAQPPAPAPRPPAPPAPAPQPPAPQPPSPVVTAVTRPPAAQAPAAQPNAPQPPQPQPPAPQPPAPQAQATPGPTPDAVARAVANPAQAQADAIAAVKRNPANFVEVVRQLRALKIPIPPELAPAEYALPAPGS